MVPEGGDELKNLLVGHLLFTEWHEISSVFVIYLVVAAIHWICRRQFFAISFGASDSRGLGNSNVRWWDFLFYSTFGVVVTSSVEIAGVLLVFSFLVVPAVCGVLLADSAKGKLIVGWLCGFISSVAGVVASYVFDLPTGATVVCVFGGCLLICLCVRRRKTCT